MKRIYLATSYTWKPKYKWVGKLFCRGQQSWLNRIVMFIRYWRVSKATAMLMTEHDVNIFSPITHSHIIPRWIPERLDTHTFWLKLDFDWINSCNEMWIYMQPGWNVSYGVREEIKHCLSLGKTIRFITMDYKIITDEDASRVLDTLEL